MFQFFLAVQFAFSEDTYTATEMPNAAMQVKISKLGGVLIEEDVFFRVSPRVLFQGFDPFPPDDVNSPQTASMNRYGNP